MRPLTRAHTTGWQNGNANEPRRLFKTEWIPTSPPPFPRLPDRFVVRRDRWLDGGLLIMLELWVRAHSTRVVAARASGHFIESDPELLDFVDDRPQKAMADRARENGFGFLDLLTLLRSHRSEAIYFDHCHPLSAANNWIGEALAQRIRSEYLTPGRKPDSSPVP